MTLPLALSVAFRGARGATRIKEHPASFLAVLSTSPGRSAQEWVARLHLRFMGRGRGRAANHERGRDVGCWDFFDLPGCGKRQLGLIMARLRRGCHKKDPRPSSLGVCCESLLYYA
jgi:hypothetical protein